MKQGINFFKSILFTGWALVVTNNLYAQDLHFSQVVETPLMLSPANAG